MFNVGSHVYNSQKKEMSEENEVHPLDQSLGDIHEAALLCQHIGQSKVAMRIAEAHEVIQKWVIDQESPLVTARTELELARKLTEFWKDARLRGQADEQRMATQLASVALERNELRTRLDAAEKDVRNLLAELRAHEENTGEALEADDNAVVLEIENRYAAMSAEATQASGTAAHDSQSPERGTTPNQGE